MKIERSVGLLSALFLASMAAMVEVPALAAPPERKSVPTEISPEVAPGKDSPPPANQTSLDEKRNRKDDLDRKLLRDLLPDLPLELDRAGENPENLKDGSAEPRSKIPFADELDEAVTAMRAVSQRLDKLNLSEDTEQLQTGIVTNIDALIEKLKNLPPTSSTSSDSSDQNQSDSDSTSQGQKSGSQPKPQQAPQKQHGADSAGEAGQKPKSGKAGESTEQNLREAKERAAALARRRALIDEVWGHLPPAMREQLLNVGSEKLLPKYEVLIRRYYEALAEPEKASSRR